MSLHACTATNLDPRLTGSRARLLDEAPATDASDPTDVLWSIGAAVSPRSRDIGKLPASIESGTSRASVTPIFLAVCRTAAYASVMFNRPR
jgi:hypothetical protein